MADIKEKFINADLLEPVRFKSDHFDVTLAITQKRGAEVNDDSAAVLAKGNHILIAVADGMGGHEKGNLASANAIEHFMSLEKSIGKSDFLTTEILEVFERSNQDILSQKHESGTTLTIVEVVDNIAMYYLVGDSRVLLFDQDGEVKIYSSGHSFYDLIKEAESEKYVKGDEEELQNTLSSFLGTEFYRMEASSRFKVNKSDMIVAGSDGLYDTVQIRKEIKKEISTTEKTCSHLMNSCLKRMYNEALELKHDDITIITLSRI